MKKHLYQWLLSLPNWFGKHISFEKYYDWEIKAGYISENGTPIICRKCHHDKMYDCNYDYLDYGTILEYDTKCKKCDALNGHWAYGHYTL